MDDFMISLGTMSLLSSLSSSLTPYPACVFSSSLRVQSILSQMVGGPALSAHHLQCFSTLSS